MIRVKQYLKWHVIAVLDHLMILSVRTTSKKTHDSPLLRTMLNRLKKRNSSVQVRYSMLTEDMMVKTTTGPSLECTCFQT